MAVRGMDDVHVAPNERPSRDGQLCLGVRAPMMPMSMTVFFAWTRARGEGRKGEREQRRQLHCRELFTRVSRPSARGEEKQ